MNTSMGGRVGAFWNNGRHVSFRLLEPIGTNQSESFRLGRRVLLDFIKTRCHRRKSIRTSEILCQATVTSLSNLCQNEFKTMALKAITAVNLEIKYFMRFLVLAKILHKSCLTATLPMTPTRPRFTLVSILPVGL